MFLPGKFENSGLISNVHLHIRLPINTSDSPSLGLILILFFHIAKCFGFNCKIACMLSCVRDLRRWELLKVLRMDSVKHYLP